MMAGTPQFIAPEQINNFGGVTHLADLYALGCIAYQMFNGEEKTIEAHLVGHGS